MILFKSVALSVWLYQGIYLRKNKKRNKKGGERETKNSKKWEAGRETKNTKTERNENEIQKRIKNCREREREEIK